MFAFQKQFRIPQTCAHSGDMFALQNSIIVFWKRLHSRAGDSAATKRVLECKHALETFLDIYIYIYMHKYTYKLRIPESCSYSRSMFVFWEHVRIPEAASHSANMLVFWRHVRTPYQYVRIPERFHSRAGDSATTKRVQECERASEMFLHVYIYIYIYLGS